MYKWAFIVFWALAIAFIAGMAGVEVRLFDFYSENALSTWVVRSPEHDSLQLSEQYASVGKHSLAFHTPAWKKDMPEWPAFEAVPAVKDWRECDRSGYNQSGNDCAKVLGVYIGQQDSI